MIYRSTVTKTFRHFADADFSSSTGDHLVIDCSQATWPDAELEGAFLCFYKFEKGQEVRQSLFSNERHNSTFRS